MAGVKNPFIGMTTTLLPYTISVGGAVERAAHAVPINRRVSAGSYRRRTDLRDAR
jgi:hypothetical protein